MCNFEKEIIDISLNFENSFILNYKKVLKIHLLNWRKYAQEGTSVNTPFDLS